jgi:hypothetical protein
MDKVMDIKLSAVAFESEPGIWIVQGIEHDISTFVDKVQDIPEAFERTVMEYVFMTCSLGRQPLQGIKPAPEKFKKMFESARSSLALVKPHERDLDIRLAASA